jgi:hypothetical protein
MRKEAGMTADTATREQVLALARRLSPADQAYLVAELAPRIAHALQHTARPAVADPEATLAEIREAFRKQGPTSPTIAEQLELDRRSREESLSGRSDDVHP